MMHPDDNVSDPGIRMEAARDEAIRRFLAPNLQRPNVAAARILRDLPLHRDGATVTLATRRDPPEIRFSERFVCKVGIHDLATMLQHSTIMLASARVSDADEVAGTR